MPLPKASHTAVLYAKIPRIPFMAMPDAVHALLQLAQAPRWNLRRLVYNVISFSLSAAQIRDRVRQAFPQAQRRLCQICNVKPSSIVGQPTWTIAPRNRWHPQYDVRHAFSEYLIPTIAARYREQAV